jgi:serine/threonine protein kinase
MTATCPDCGNLLPPDAPQGQCPRCLLQAGFQSEPPIPQPTATRSYGSHAGFQPPSVAELQARIPQYEILELVGQGGMGAVYKARQVGLGRLVAIKILPFEINQTPGFAERFAREARALALLSHPHIVAVHDFGQADGLCYFVMEYVDGVNLRQAIQAGKISTREALAIVPQICDALQFAHDEGVVHRDIKPENVLIDKRGRVKIADFGLAKLLGVDPFGGSLTGTQQVMGTLRYMAPEQMSGAKEVDHRADIFSLGVVFYELLTGELPIGRFAPPSKKAQIDARLDDVVLRALENEPALRYQQVSELKTGVEAAGKPAVEQAPAPQPLRDAAPAESPFWGTQVSLVACTSLTFITLAVVLYTGIPLVTMMFGPDTELINFGRQWGLGNTVDKVAPTILLILAVVLSVTGWAWWKYQSALPARSPRMPRPTPPAVSEAGPSVSSSNFAADLQPRLSQAAVWGAVLAPLFFVALVVLGAAVVPVSVQRSGDAPAGPSMLLKLLLIPLFLLEIIGLLAPFATTILGAISISQIRHSRGRLYGMPLAVFDALVFPLLLLDAVLIGVGTLAFSVALQFVLKAPAGTNLSWMGMFLLVVLLLVPLVALLDLYLVRLTWRAATSNLPGDDTQRPFGKEPPKFQPERRTDNGWVVLLIVLAAGTIPFLLCGGVLTAYFLSSRSARRLDEPARMYEHDPAGPEMQFEHVREAGPPAAPH